MNGGNNAEYYKLTTSLARSGAPGAEDIFVKYASAAKDADTDEALRQHFARCSSSQSADYRQITVGTLLLLARQSGANFDRWRCQAVSALPPDKRKLLRGGIYSPDEALTLLNSHYLIGKSDQEVAIFRIKDDSLLGFTPPEQFRLDVANIFVQASPTKPIPVKIFWEQSPLRHEKAIVFKPSGEISQSEFNLWRGFAVKPGKGRQKVRRLVRHIWKVISRRDKDKFNYLIRWLAWAVQNPHKQAAVVIVLKSRKQGTGKSTLGFVMLNIFGQHGVLLDESDRLLGRFNDWAETVSFILAEEILWAGDHKTADKLKSRITADMFQIERKNGGIRQIPNRLHIIMTTNHDHAVGAGVGDRRFVVYDISDEHACDRSWFDPLYRDLDQGGYGEFLDFLQNVQLGDWHPRQLLKTPEAVEQQRMSSDSVSQWSQACIEADAIIGRASHGFVLSSDLGERISSEGLREAYSAYCKQQGVRPINAEAFGKACTEMFGARIRLPSGGGTVADAGPPSEVDEALEKRVQDLLPAAEATKAEGTRAKPIEGATLYGPFYHQPRRRPWGYEVPDGDTWQRKLNARLGIKD